ncbi:hypothetical protein GN244_ATG13288 [Phytophthora infestans]|uniref:Uncharacterized protein n=1 Tax=Phytophthora infestans TaxID=4787 RepID=A0A833T6W8_PHYIN|nr:hypothetical protein GN244_ATG13288 [Phytophthora infestans]
MDSDNTRASSGACVEEDVKTDVASEGSRYSEISTKKQNDENGEETTKRDAQTAESDNLSALVLRMQADADGRDTERAQRYVDTVRPSIAATRFVRTERERELREYGEVRRTSRAMGLGTGEGARVGQTGESTTSQREKSCRYDPNGQA